MIYIYNTKLEDHTDNPNNYPIYRSTILGNPFTHDGKKSSLARFSFRTRDEAVDAYRPYFKGMYKNDAQFKALVDEIYEKYKEGEDIYLQCFCAPLRCHGEIIRDELQKRLIKEKMAEVRQKSASIKA